MSLLTYELAELIEQSEVQYMIDRMRAIEERPGNPMGIELAQFGRATAFFAREMPWPQFNTVKGMGRDDVGWLDEIIGFYAARERKPQFEITPSNAEGALLKGLASRGYYQSGFHASLYINLLPDTSYASHGTLQGEQNVQKNDAASVNLWIKELSPETGLEQYASIHCLGTGLPVSGEVHIADNNEMLLAREGWSFYIAYTDGKTPAGAAVMHVGNGIASLTFAAVLPKYRGRGIHQALIRKRLDKARQSGCTMAVGQAAYVSASARNMERSGMKLGYTRATWTSM
ncbi:GNAT family N-acetyltransferase [Paenibacillus sp. GCM10012307]|uniref:GNAT family N-acetyltransferase n=1 Tax=Paenibacillus roseus TaxID=2798579 RepID=A0A934J5C2_9BACL|nr:GNAT family N-acetyltransferase [Paenibacillus roseus]MBJ6360652.1 GNAT family N-acetyltransferase [Paenibacillus roseus]